MIAALMAYGVIATGLLLLAGMVLEWATPVTAIRRRFIWCGAILLSFGLTAIAGVRLLNPDNEAGTFAAKSLSHASAEASLPSLPLESQPIARSITARFAGALSRPIGAAGGANLNGGILLLGWGILSGALLLAGIATAARNSRLRRAWQVAEMEGHRVRVSPKTGPAVLGIWRPEIVVPGWLLASSPEERRLALLHEAEHLRARDGFVLAAAWGAVMLLPWNPALWWMGLRLRLAIEIDCDQRVLASGAERLSYGSMLIDVSGHPSGFSIATPALAGFPSNLERRLLAITSRTSGRFGLRGGVGVLVAGTLLLVACRADLPTAAEIEAMDAAMIAERARDLGIEPTAYYIDGQVATPEQAAALPSGTIASVDVIREGRAGGVDSGSIRIYTRSPAAPSYEIDGRAATVAEFNALNAEEIESIVVQRDPNASRDPLRANGGTVVVTTKVASSRVGAGNGDGGAGTVSVGADMGGGDRVKVQAISASVTGPVIEVEPDGYSLRFAVPEAAASEEPDAGSIPLRNMGEPLFVIDGVVSNAEAFDRLSPSAIEGISVLKGASASDFGDPRSANGVILVTTRAQ